MEVAIGRDENFSRHRVDTHTHTGISDELNTPFRVNAVVPLLQSDLPLFVPNYRRFPIKWRIAFSLAAGNFGIEKRTTIVESTISKASSKRNFGECIEIRFGNLEKKAEEVSRVVFFPSVPRDCVARVEASRFEVNKTKFKVCSKLSRMYNARCPPPPPPLLLPPAPVCIALRPRQFSYRLPSLT